MSSMTPEARLAALNTVQRRVAAIAFFAVTVHGTLGVLGAAYAIRHQDRHSDVVLLVIMSAFFAMITYSGVRLILGKRWWSPVWLVVALVPTVAGAIWIA